VEIRLLSVNVGRPRIIGHVNGEPVSSGIGKEPVAHGAIFVSQTNIAGDAQADLSVHGGVDKAVYAYPADHWPWWEGEAKLACGPATFGENLTLAGADENVIAIGDRFRWGDAVLEVSQPRAPCYKFGIHTARPDAPQLMTLSARCGWYLRVLREGSAPAEGVLTRISSNGGPSVREAFLAVFVRQVETERLHAVEEASGLAESWRKSVSKRLEMPLQIRGNQVT
jgi:MOSC domain-containing protein YiiM